MNNLAETSQDVNLEDELDRIFGPEGEFTKACEDLGKTLRDAQESIEKGFCSKHQCFKEDLFNDGTLLCDPCFYEYHHYDDEGLEDDDEVES